MLAVNHVMVNYRCKVGRESILQAMKMARGKEMLTVLKGKKTDEGKTPKKKKRKKTKKNPANVVTWKIKASGWVQAAF